MSLLDWKKGITALLLPFFLVLVVHLLFEPRWQVSVFIGFGTMSLFWFVMRRTLLRDHVRGLKNFRSGAFREALADFREARLYLSERPHLDRYGSLLFGASSRLGYHDMALLNIAGCHLMLGEDEQGREHYEQALRANPRNVPAQMALQAIDSSLKDAPGEAEMG